METKMKNSITNSLWKWTLGVCMLFVGMQSAWANDCEGDVYIKAPADWGSVWVATQNHEPKQVTDHSNGYYHVDLKTWPQETYHVTNFSVGTFSVKGKDKNGQYTDDTTLIKTYDTTAVVYVDTVLWGVVESGDKGKLKNYTPFTCPGDGKALYIYENPAKPGYSVIDNQPPNAKYFYVMIPPDMTAWMSSVPMISLDGGKTGKEMKADPDKCGWYYFVFFDEIPTDNVVLYRDDDDDRKDMLGVNGNWEEGATAQPIPLASLFSSMNTLYFVPDQEKLLDAGDNGFYDVYPEVEGACSYTLAAVIYDTDASLHGAFTCNPDWHDGQSATEAHSNACSYPSAPYQVAKADGTIPCIGVTKGMVTDELDHTKGSATYKKPRLTATGKACFGAQADEAFTAMFNSNPTVNETYCVDMPFGKSNDGKWEFDSDNYQSPGATVPGGFYPAETTPPLDRMISAPLTAAENKRKAEGPVFLCEGLRALHPTEGVPYGDLLCEGPGWAGGSDCSGLFAGGSEFKGTFNGVTFSGDGWGWGCPNEAPTGWNFYTKGTEKKVGTVEVKGQIPGNGDSRWASGASDKTVLTDGTGRNQHFCFESHAKFTYRKGLKFSFRGDDDIWVYIDNKLAVDLGGTHLAAPGYVNLDNFVGASGALKPEVDYDLDIFFCDRRTTMSNVRIKTNMYIRQKTAIDLTRDPGVTNAKSYNVCYTTKGDGSCAAAIAGGGEEQTDCGEAILANHTVSYWLVEGSKLTDSTKALARSKHYETPGVYNCILDLTNFVKPTIGNAKDMCEIGTGRYTLFMEIDGKSAQVATFRPQGDVDVVYAEAVAKDTSSAGTVLGKYSPKTVAMAGEWVPVYITSVHKPEKDTDPLDLFPQDAAGSSYTLKVDDLVQVCLQVAEDGSCATPMDQTMSRIIGPTGVDTVYVTVNMEDLAASSVFNISVAGKTTSLQITFFLPEILFIQAIPDSGMLPVEKPGEVPDPETGEYEEYWVGGMYDFFMAIFKPDGKGGLILCPECELTVHRGNGTSDQVMFDEVTFQNGYATITVISTKEYRAISNNAASIEVSNALGTIKKTYTPVFFRDPPVPTPRLADVFDARGATPSMEFNIPAPYFSMNQEYLDGIADSVAIYYHRRFHRDSLPTKICIAWDSSQTNDKTLWHNPYKEGFSTIAKDTSMFCNAFLSDGGKHIDCSMATDADPYCTNKVLLGGLTLSGVIKTGGSGKLISYGEFMEEDAKGNKKEAKQGFPTNLVDRVAPIPLRAEVRNIKKGDERSKNDELVVIMSEPVKLVATANKLSALDYYLISSTELADNQRYASVMGGASVVTAPMEPTVSTTSEGQGSITVIYNVEKLSPQVDDYARLTGNLASVYWSDDADITAMGNDTLRDPTDEAKFHWNSPTGLDDGSLRLPSPWVLITGEAKGYTDENKFAHTGNAPAGENVPVFSVKAFSSNKTFQDILSDPEVAGTPGQWLHPGMLRAYNALPDSIRKGIDPKDIYVQYEIQYFTNLGNYVAGTKGKIYCDDTKNDVKYFNGGLCTETNDMHFFFGWNMRSDKGRTVGTGAYIMKFNSFIKLGSAGKDYKIDETSVYGVKRSNKPYVGYLNAGEDK